MRGIGFNSHWRHFPFSVLGMFKELFIIFKENNVRLGGNFVSDKFRIFCKSLNIEQAFLLSYHHQSNGQVEACIKFVKCTLKKCFDSKGDSHIALLQICMTLLGPGLPNPVTILFTCPIRGNMPISNRPPVGRDKDEEYYELLTKRQTNDDKNQSTPEIMFLFPQGLL